MMTIPRSEYPRPQFVREQWLNLNDEWGFEIDNSLSGKEKEFFKRKELTGKILVPFCPESELSGVNNKDFMYCVWYKRNFTVPESWIGKNIILHFGAVDYKTTVYINGEEVGTHSGGYTSFSFDITKYLKDNENYITVCAEDDVKSGIQPSGKQSGEYAAPKNCELSNYIDRVFDEKKLTVLLLCIILMPSHSGYMKST